ncbi:hypothetical protein ACQPZF_36485 [Actinosynnema sp. CS-041913]|uniref:hypothetical protein n=1 Tax=Actinosynnema sp. CS-041913 TaxID=3239917 RepID=UPI003D8D7F4C
MNIVNAVQGGDITTAKRYAGHLLAELDPHTFGIVADCVNTIERYPDRADVHLRARWKSATSDTDRSLIATFGEAFVQRAPRRTPDPHLGRTGETAPRDLRTEIRPDARRVLTPQRRARLREQDRQDTVVADYADRAGVDDQPPPDTVYAGGLDYDRAAVPALRGTPCVRCWLERVPADHRAISDDGLCGECRDKGRPGIPALPEGHTRADAVEARCAFITATYTNARGLLARWWKAYATPADRAVITDWVHRNPFPQPPAATAPPAKPDHRPEEATKCAQCGDPRDTTAELCADCREVEQMVTTT